MNREQFEDLMLTDQKTFAGYARLFMDLKGTQLQGFLDWCWEKYHDGHSQGPVLPALESTFIRTVQALLVFPGIRFSEERNPYPRI